MQLWFGFTCYTEQLFIVSEHNFTKCNILACKLYRNIWKCNHQSYNLMASITQTIESDVCLRNGV